MNDSAADIIYDEIKEAVAEEYNVAKNKVELCSVRIDGEGHEPTTVVAKIDNKKVVLLQYETDTINEHLPRDIESLVLNEAGYTAQDKVDQDKQSQVDAEFTSAVNAILARFATISDEITLVKANEIFSEFSSTTSVPGFENCEGIILSNIREDGTAVAFTYEYGVYQDHVLKVEGRENMTDAQIMAQIAAGNFTKETRTIDSSKTYATPALEEKPVVETITVGEIYDQNFANVDFSAKLEEAFQNIYGNYFTGMNVDTLFYAQNNKKVDLYSNIEYKGGQNFYKLTFDCDLDLTSLSENSKNVVLDNLGLSQLDEVEKNNTDEIKNRIEAEIKTIQSQISKISDIQDVSQKNLLAGTKDNIDVNAFGEKLCPDKEVIATYVGAQTGKTNDSAHEFNTGYYTQFKVVVVYLENEDVVVENNLIYAPYYNDSTNESIYNTFLTGEENKNYKVVSKETQVISGAVIADQPQAASYQIVGEYIIEGLDEESTKIAADALASYFADELAR